MRAVVLGACGAVGREVARELVRVRDFHDLVLADLDRARLRELGRALGGLDTRSLDVTDAPALRRLLGEVGLVVNCTTYVHGVRILRAAIAAGVDYLDLGGLYVTPKQLELDARARKAGIRAVLGCGATPGLSNVLARRAADRLDAIHEVHISFASHRDLVASPGLLDTVLDEFRPGVPRFLWRDGRLRPVRPFEGAQRVRFADPIGEQEVYYVPHSETHTLPRSFPDGLREVAVRGTWRREDMAALRTLAELGLTSDRAVRVRDVSVRPLEVVRSALLAHPPPSPATPWAFYLHVRVEGKRDGRTVSIRQRTRHPRSWGRHATGRMTAVPAAVGATLLARGAVTPLGVLPPERAFEPEAFLAGVRRRGVDVTLASRRR